MPELQVTYQAALVITSATAPQQGYLNLYNASAGALSVPMPALSSCPDGTNLIVAKDPADTTLNAVTFTRSGSDAFLDGSTSFTLTRPGRQVWLQVVTVAGIKYWAVIMAGELNMRGGITTITSQVSVTNTNSAFDIISTTLPAASLFAGSVYKAVLDGEIQTSNVASSSLTFTPYIQGAALAQTAVIASPGVANAASAFHLEFLIVVRSTGASGTAIAKPRGMANLATTGLTHLISTTTSTTTINTTAAASSNVLKVAAQWGAANASNSLLVDIATLERVI